METKRERKAYQKQYRAENYEKIAAQTKQWKAENPEKVVAYQNKWKAANPDKLASNHKKWKAANPEKRKAAVKKWQDSNPEKYAAIAKANQAKAIENLSDSYVSTQLSRRKDIHQTAAQLREYPEIIECFRAVLKLRRMCRTKNKEKL